MSNSSQIKTNQDGSLTVDPNGTKIQILYISKKTGQTKQAPVSVGPERGLYYAVFDEDDVDFQISIDNSVSRDRSVCVGLEIRRENHRFVVHKESKGILETFESKGKKFHFIRQSSEDGVTLVSTAAGRHGLTFADASILISRMKVSVEFSKQISSDSFTIWVKLQDGSQFQLQVEPSMTVVQLKTLIEDATGRPMDEQTNLICHGITVDGGRLDDYDDVTPGSTFNLIYASWGGGDCVDCSRLEGPCNLANCTMGEMWKVKQEEQERMRKAEERMRKTRIGERGVICFGANCDQQFVRTQFYPDKSVKIEPVTIEMRLAAKYS